MYFHIKKPVAKSTFNKSRSSMLVKLDEKIILSHEVSIIVFSNSLTHYCF
jgi:hypothetical protein